jgi:hypothetical protein
MKQMRFSRRWISIAVGCYFLHAAALAKRLNSKPHAWWTLTHGTPAGTHLQSASVLTFGLYNSYMIGLDFQEVLFAVSDMFALVADLWSLATASTAEGTSLVTAGYASQSSSKLELATASCYGYL